MRTESDRCNRSTLAVALRNPFIIVLAAVVTGILADRFISIAMNWWVICSVISFAAMWYSVVTGRSRIGFASLFVATAALLGCWHHLHWRLYPESEISRILPQDPHGDHAVLVEAIAVEHPTTQIATTPNPMATVPRGDRTSTRIRFSRIRSNGRWRVASGLADMFVEGHLVGVKAGSRMQILGRLSRPKRAINPGERDRRMQRRGERVLSQLHVGFPDCVSVIPNESVSALERVSAVLNAVRGRCHAAIERHVGSENSELAKALLLGARDGVASETIDAFFLTGTMHLLAISGLHVSILAFAFFFAAQRGLLPYRLSLALVMLFILLYAVLTGARPPVIRAAILIQVLCASLLAKRRVSPVNALSLAAIVVLVINPCDLFRVGAQLSFIAVASLSWFGSMYIKSAPTEPLDRLIWRTRTWPKRVTDFVRHTISTMILASLLVWLVCLPLTSYQFHIASPVSILLNLVLAIPVAVALIAGVATIAAAAISPFFAGICGSLCDTSLATMHRIVTIAEPVPGSHFWTPGYGLPWTITFYVIVILCGLRIVRPGPRWGCVFVLMWFAMPVIANNLHQFTTPPKLRTTVIAVGHGTSVLMEFPNGRTLLYDCGHMGIPESAVEVISGALWSRGRRTIDTVVISHADADHYNAYPGLSKRFAIGKVIVGPDMFGGNSDSVSYLQEAVAVSGVPLRIVAKGQRLNLDDSVECSVTHPSQHAAFESDNAASIVLQITYANRTLLFPADIEKEGLEHLLLQQIPVCDVMMAPHHGSRNSQPLRFREWSKPQRTIISAGAQTAEELAPALEIFGANGEVFHTHRDGAITIDVDGDSGDIVTNCFLRQDR